MTAGKEPEMNAGAAAATGLEIAVIGMAGRFPGAANIPEFWDNLKNGVESIGFFSHRELEQAGVEPDLLNHPDYVEAFGFIENTDHFDASFFGYTPGEARLLLPQARIYQQCVWEALEDAGVDPDSDEDRIGIYAGASSSMEWEMLTLLEMPDLEVDGLTRLMLTNKDSISTVIAYRLNLKGPAVLVQTACSTSLAAVHLAVQGLLSGECEIALAGGVTISLSGKNGYLFQEGMIESTDGHVRAFDARASGTVAGSGAAVIVLKLLEEAVSHRDHIYAVVKGSAINNDGTRKVGYTAPSVEGQTEVIKTAHYTAEVEPETIGYLEAHGTATKLGDPVEIEALKAAFVTDKKGFCAIGSVKTNVGHLDNAAGAVGFIKTALVLYHKLIPPSLHFESPNPHIDFENSPFYVVTSACEWKPHKPAYPLRAGVSSFGIGGTNVHVVLEQAPEGTGGLAPLPNEHHSRRHQLILLSAKTETALDKMTENLSGYFKKNLLNRGNHENPTNPGPTLADAAYTLQTGRKIFPYRRMLVCSRQDIAGAAARLESSDSTVHTDTPSASAPVVFMFPGQGAQYVNMGRELYEKEPYFRQEMNRCFEILDGLLDYDIKEVLYPFYRSNRSYTSYKSYKSHIPKINRTEIAQPLLFAIEYSLARLLMKWGIEPAAMIGHSIGEYAAACLAGVFSLADALELVVIRGRLMQQMPGGTMLSVSMPEEQLTPLLAANKEISLAAVNAPSGCVVAGTNQDMEEFEARLKQQGDRIQWRRLHTSHAFHSKTMEPILDEFAGKVRQKQFQWSQTQTQIQIPFISNLTGEWMAPEDAVSPGYWAQHLRQPVRFARGLSQLLTMKNAFFIEVGPGRTLNTFVNQHPGKKIQQKVIHLMRHPQENISDVYFLFMQVGRLWLYGQPIDWVGFYGEEEKQRRRISLPTYPFEPQCFRVGASPGQGQGLLAGIREKFGSTPVFADWFYIPTWMQQILLPPDDVSPGVRYKWLVFIDNCGLGQRLVKELKQKGHEVITLEPGSEFVKQNPGTYTINPKQSRDYDKLFNDPGMPSIPSRIVHLWGVTGTGTAAVDMEGFEKFQEWGFYSLLYTVRAIGSTGKGKLNRQFQIDVVTNHMQEVTGEERLCPAKAAVIGLVRVIPQEFPGIRCRGIDVLPAEPGSKKEKKLLDQLVEEISIPPIEPVVAYRGSSRWVQTFHPLRMDKTRENHLKSKLREGGVYLVTGGTGNIGLMLAQYLAKKVRAKLILTARSWVPPREEWEQWLRDHDAGDDLSQKITRVKELEQMGARVRVFSVDAADKGLMQQIVTRTEEEWGPINGVIHAAGGMKRQSWKSLEELEKTDFEEQFQAKVKGLYVLAELFQGKEPDFYLLLSSIAAILGGLGFGAYAPANCFMDAFARERERYHPGKWISVNWDGMDKEKTQLAFERILSLGKAVGVAVSNGGRLQERIDRWVKLEFLEEEKKNIEKDAKYLTPRPVLMNPYVPPRGYVQQTMASMWQNLFGLDRVGIQDDFFELGGDSLKATVLISRIHRQLNVKIPLAEVFRQPTIKGLAQYIKEAETDIYVSIQPVEKREYYPLSSAQKRMFLVNRFKGNDTSDNTSTAMVVEGKLNNHRLEEVFRQLIERHETLRTGFEIIADEPVQRIHNEVEFEIEYYRVEEEEAPFGHVLNARGGHSPESQELRAKGFIYSFIRPFDLSRAPLLRIGLVKPSPQTHILLFDMHHIVSDGSSTAVMEKEFVNLYQGGKLPGVRVQYKDFSLWQNRILRSEFIKKQEAYWVEQFTGNIPVLHLPIDYERPRVQGFTGDNLEFEFSSDLSGKLDTLVLENDATLFMVLLALYTLLLFKYSGQEDIVVGTPIAGRRHPDLEPLIGMFVNTLAMRNYPCGKKTFREFLEGVKSNTLKAYENQDYQFEELVNRLKIRRDPGRNILFDTMFTLAAADLSLENREITGLTYKQYKLETRATPFDILFYAYKADIVSFKLMYSTALFKKETMERWAGHFSNIAEAVAANPNIEISGIQVISEEEKQELLFDFNAADAEYAGDKTIHELFEARAARTPDQIAVKGTGGLAPLPVSISLTYKELNQKSNQLARLLKKKGVVPDTIVGIMMDNSPELIVGLLGILKSGGIYLPIGPDLPAKRITAMLKDSNAPLVLTKDQLLKSFKYIPWQNFEHGDITPVVTAPRVPVKNLDSLQIPDRSLIDYEKYRPYIAQAMVKNSIILQFSRGCVYNCAYCFKIWPGGYTCRTAENIFEEIRFYYKMGIRRFGFVDDLPNINIKESSKLYRLIVRDGLKVHLHYPNGIRGDILTGDYIDLMVEAGTVTMDLALETTSRRLQGLIRKNLNIEKLEENIQYIIDRYPHVILETQILHGLPTETEEEARASLDFVKGLKWIHFPYIHILKIYPNTAMAAIALENGISREAVEESADLGYHELPETLPFDRNFTRKYQAEFLNEYFMAKERLLSVLPRQMKALTKDELVQKYNSYLPVKIRSFPDLLDYMDIDGTDIVEEFLPEDFGVVPGFNEKLYRQFSPKKTKTNALRILLLDLSQYFSHESDMIYDVVEPPLGLMYVLTHLNRRFQDKINGKIAKSRIDFDSFRELQSLIRDFEPDAIGVRSLNFYKDFFHKTLSLIRQWGVEVPIIAGGPYATSSYQTMLKDKNIDLAILGEGEITLAEIIGKTLDNGGKLPDEQVLKDIPGLAFVAQKHKLRQEQWNRDLMLLDRIEEQLSRQPGENLNLFTGSGESLAYIIYTSGSTGTPKGVMARHNNLVNQVSGLRETFELEAPGPASLHYIMLAAFTFDVSLMHIFLALTTGAKLFLVTDEMKKDSDKLWQFIRENHIDILNIVPAFMKIIIKNLGKKKMHFKYLFVGGDVFDRELYVGLKETFAAEKTINIYGPTETTINATFHECRHMETGTAIPIGKPLVNYKAYIKDRDSNLVPIGVVGELYIGGAGVTRGYLNNPELTARRFLYGTDRFYRSYRSYMTYILYKTGDLARWLADGNIEFLGRIDHQVKIRGFRIEPGEIENRLSNHVDIEEAVVIARENQEGDKYLCAYIVPVRTKRPEPQPPPHSKELRQYLSQTLPGYMIPSYFVPIDGIPVTFAGKVDRKALPAPRLGTAGDYVEPRNEIEAKLAKIWLRVLDPGKDTLHDPIGIDDNFFELGGHSLKATILIAKLHKELNVKLPLAEVFKTPSVRGLSQCIMEAGQGQFTPLEPMDKKEYYPLSSAQKRLYVLQQLNPDGTGYNIPQVGILEGEVDKEKFAVVFRKLIHRHQGLRTSFHMKDNEPVQRIDEQLEFNIDYDDISKVEEEKRKTEEKRQMTEDKPGTPLSPEFFRPFDLSRAPLMRVGLIKAEEHRYILIVDMHHIITDGSSMSILVEEFMALYEGKELPRIRLQYRDYSQWQARLYEKREITYKSREKYWLKQFEEGIPQLNFPTDYPRPEEWNFKGDAIVFEIDKKITGKIRKILQETGTTPYILLLAVYTILLAKYTSKQDIVVGTGTAGRTHADLEHIIGMFINMLAIKNRPREGQTFYEYLTEVKENTLAAFENQDYQFEELVRRLNLTMQPGKNPLFDVEFTFQNVFQKNLEIPGLTLKPYPRSRPNARFDLTLHAAENNGTITVQLIYAIQLFKRSTIEDIKKNFIETLEQVTADPEIKLEDIKVSYRLSAASSNPGTHQIQFDF